MQKEYIRLTTYLGDKEATGIIRVMLPYILLNQSYPEILANYDFVLHNEESFYNGLKILQVQRQCTPNQLQIIKSVKERFKDIKIFYDIDDWILGIPEYNDSYNYYTKFRDIIVEILKRVDCIICSTPELASYMNKYNKVKIIKNRLIRSLWEDNNYYKDIPERPIILWAGGTQHFSNNLNIKDDFSDEIIKYIERTTDKYCWTFIGSLPLKLINNKNIVFYPWNSYFEYCKLIRKIKPYIGIALLTDNIFNKCKSNIKALEYTSINIPGVYSNITPYKNLSCTFNNSDEFIDYIEELCIDFDYYNSVKIKDYNTLSEQLYWDDGYMKQYLKTYLK